MKDDPEELGYKALHAEKKAEDFDDIDEYINYLNNGLGLFDNYSLEELDISRNYLKEDCAQFLAKILSHLKGLKSQLNYRNLIFND